MNKNNNLQIRKKIFSISKFFLILKAAQVIFPSRFQTEPTMNKVKNLYKFQREAVKFVSQRNGKALIADEMGLGKTVEALAWAEHRKDLRPALVVCPSIMKLVWKQEIRKWTTSQPRILNGKKSSEILGEENLIYIVNYEVIQYWAKPLSKIIKLLILDECHYIKNFRAKRTKAVCSWLRNTPSIVALSGTPVINRPIEFFTTLNMINPKLFPSFFFYATKFCNAKKTKWGWDFSGSSNTMELNKLLSTVMIRRKKEDVLQELPKKVRTIIPVKLGNDTNLLYLEMRKQFISWVRNSPENFKKKVEIFSRMEQLKSIVRKEKLSYVSEWIRNALTGSDQKIVVFATRHFSIDFLLDSLSDFNPVSIDSRTPHQERMSSIDKFTKDETCKLFIGGIRSAGVGITLTVSPIVCFAELGWTPTEHDQAEDRVHRIGQKESVSIYYFVAHKTIEASILRVLDRKRNTVSEILDGRSVSKEEIMMETLMELINEERRFASANQAELDFEQSTKRRQALLT